MIPIFLSKGFRVIFQQLPYDGNVGFFPQSEVKWNQALKELTGSFDFVKVPKKKKRKKRFSNIIRINDKNMLNFKVKA